MANDAVNVKGPVAPIITPSASPPTVEDEILPGKAHLVVRGVEPDDNVSQNIEGYDPERMRGRAYLSAGEERKLLRRIDWHLMPLCSLMFLWKNLDADNASNARIMNTGTHQNIMTQLGMTANEYNLVTTLYYIPYIVAETPSNLLIKKALPSRWQARIMVTWGLCLACHAAVKSKEGLYAARFFLGLFEAGLFPGVIYQMTYWYRPDEMALRLLYFYILGNFSGIISGVLAFAFDLASGSGGLSGWQWLFLSEGIVTIVFGVSLWFILPDFPATAKWLTDKEKAFIQARLPSNAPRAAEMNFRWREIVTSFRDRRLWMFTLIWAFFTVGTSGVRFYQPTVIANLGFTGIAKTQLLNIPISVLACVCIGVFGLWADKSARIPRPVYPLSFCVVILSMYAVMYTFPSTGGVYAATVIANALSSAWYPMMWPWRVQTTAGATGSAFSIGFVNSYGQIGGAVSSQIFRSEYAPKYTVSFAIAMAFVGACICMILATWWVTRKTEKRTRELRHIRDEAAKKNVAVLEDVVDDDLGKAN